MGTPEGYNYYVIHGHTTWVDIEDGLTLWHSTELPLNYVAASASEGPTF